MMDRLVVISASLACVLVTTPVRAAPPTADECATADEQAQPLRKAGKLRAAKQHLLICINKTCPAVVRDDCTAQFNEIEKAVPTVVFDAKDASGNDLTAARVKMDGDVLVDHLDGSPVAVDPGEHVFRFETAGAAPIAMKLVLHEAEKERRVHVSIGTPRDNSSPATEGSHEKPPDAEASPSRWPVYAAFGVGGAALIVGVVSAVLAANQAGQCNGITKQDCDAKYGNYDSTLSMENAGWIAGFSVALVGAGIGTYLLLSMPADGAQAAVQSGKGGRSPFFVVAPRIGLGFVGLEGRFQ
jgi:hypothetical protein